MNKHPPYAPVAIDRPPPNAVMALLLGLAFTAFHAAYGLQLSHSVLMQSFNWLFDYDSSRFIVGWCTPGAEAGSSLDISFVPRHALSLPSRALCQALLPLAGEPGRALMLLTALCAGANVVTAYLLAAAFCAEELDRAVAALGFGLSAMPLMLGVIPETFGFAMLGIGIHFVLQARRLDRGLGGGATAVFSLFLDIGFTVTNGVLNAVSSAVMAWRRMPLRQWLLNEARVWLFAAAALVAVTAAAALVFNPGLLGIAGSAPQKVWWIININRGEPASLLMVVCTFVMYSFVAPAYSVIDLPVPDGHPMLDFRQFQFSTVGWLALALWAVAMAFSVLAAWRGGRTRRLLVVVVAWLLCNIGLHWYWQYRGSITIYTPHTAFALFALLAVGYGAALDRFSPVSVRVGVVLLLVLAGANNFGVYAQMVGFIMRQPLAP